MHFIRREKYEVALIDFICGSQDLSDTNIVQNETMEILELVENA